MDGEELTGILGLALLLIPGTYMLYRCMHACGCNSHVSGAGRPTHALHKCMRVELGECGNSTSGQGRGEDQAVGCGVPSVSLRGWMSGCKRQLGVTAVTLFAGRGRARQHEHTGRRSAGLTSLTSHCAWRRS